MKIGYKDFIFLCRISVPETWCETLQVKEDGVYVKAIGQNEELMPQERAALAEHPTGNLLEPALKFPCELSDFRQFLEDQGLYGCIDPFEMADWLEKNLKKEFQQIQAEGLTLPSGSYASNKLSTLKQASNHFWGSTNNPDLSIAHKADHVIKWLEDRGFSSELAKNGATIIRPDSLKLGRPAEK